MDDIPQIQIKATIKQLQINPSPKVFRKAMQYLRQLHLQLQHMANLDPASPVVCLHFAYIRKRKEFPRDDVLKRLGLKDTEYTSLFQTLKARLRLDLTLPIAHLAMKYKCANIKEMAKENYDTFKKRFEKTIHEDQLKFVKWGDEYPIAVLFLTAQRQKLKIDLLSMLKDTNISRSAFEDAKTRIVELCSDRFGSGLVMGTAGKTAKDILAEDDSNVHGANTGGKNISTTGTSSDTKQAHKKNTTTSTAPDLSSRREQMRDKIRATQQRKKKQSQKKLLNKGIEKPKRVMQQRGTKMVMDEPNRGETPNTQQLNRAVSSSSHHTTTADSQPTDTTSINRKQNRLTKDSTSGIKKGKLKQITLKSFGIV